MEQCRSHLVGNIKRTTHAEKPTDTRRAGNTGDPRSGRVAARGGGCATGACRHRANHRGPRFHAGESEGRPHLTRCIHQRERLLLSEQRGLLYALREALFLVIIYRHGADFSTFVIHHRDLPFRAGGASRAISRAMVCALEMASSSSLQSRPAESTSLWPFFTSKKYRDIFRTAFCLVLRARPQLFVAAQGWDRAGHATRRSLWPNHQSFDPQIVPTHRASGSNGNGMGCDLNDRKVHSASGN